MTNTKQFPIGVIQRLAEETADAWRECGACGINPCACDQLEALYANATIEIVVGTREAIREEILKLAEMEEAA